MIAYKPVGRTIDVQLFLEDIRIDTKKATSLGLILNELLTNSLKYAFAEGIDGKVQVELKKTGRGIELSVIDDGSGLPRNFDPKTSGGFGLRLVGMLVKQGKGGIEYECNTDTVFRAWISLL
ncbi:MAG TPA: sensor histidine kinase [Spirochaetota bacterium]|nr:sensor histidine kinase [Spirochaetota bacterium]